MSGDGKKVGNADAFETAVKYLAVSPRSEKEVREKLYSKGFHKADVEQAIAKAKAYRYIDDEQYVRSYFDFYGRKYGRQKLKYKLAYEKGVDKTLTENMAQDLLTDEEEEEKAYRFASRYASQKKLSEKKDAVKVGAFLYSKGFERTIINKILPRLFDEDFTDLC